MGFNDELNKITNDLLGVFFPRKCPFWQRCGQEVLAVPALRRHAAAV